MRRGGGKGSDGQGAGRRLVQPCCEEGHDRVAAASLIHWHNAFAIHMARMACPPCPLMGRNGAFVSPDL
jgi:hypothetical protein